MVLESKLMIYFLDNLKTNTFVNVLINKDRYLNKKIIGALK